MYINHLASVTLLILTMSVGSESLSMGTNKPRELGTSSLPHTSPLLVFVTVSLIIHCSSTIIALR